MTAQLDGAGQLKLATLDQGMTDLQRLHALVERFGVAVKNQQETGGFKQQLVRAATPLVGLLKPQFGPIADQVTSLVLVASRGGGDQAKLRALREAVAQVRVQLEIAVTKVTEKHAIGAEPNAARLDRT